MSGARLTDDRERYHAFDALRASAMLLGIFYHAALSFVDPPILQWAANDASRTLGVGLFAWASHGFRMQVFFVMAGFFTAMLQRRYSLGRFLRHRVERILFPFTVGVVTISPLVFTVFLWGRQAGVRLDELPVDALAALAASTWLDRVHPSHLWFLEYLLIFSLAAMLGCRGRTKLLRDGFRRVLRSRWAPVFLALPTAAVALQHGGSVVSAEVKSFVPGPALLYYGLFFGFGWLLYGERHLLPAFSLRYRRWLIAAVLLLPTPLLILVGQGREGLPYAAVLMVYHALSSLYSWAAVYGLIGLFLHRFHVAHPAIRYVSDAAYWLYLAHLPLVAALQVVFAQTPFPGVVKYAGIVGISLAVLFLTYEHGVRYTVIGAVLNGRRSRENERAVAAGRLGFTTP